MRALPARRIRMSSSKPIQVFKKLYGSESCLVFGQTGYTADEPTELTKAPSVGSVSAYLLYIRH